MASNSSKIGLNVIKRSVSFAEMICIVFSSESKVIKRKFSLPYFLKINFRRASLIFGHKHFSREKKNISSLNTLN